MVAPSPYSHATTHKKRGTSNFPNLVSGRGDNYTTTNQISRYYFSAR